MKTGVPLSASTGQGVIMIANTDYENVHLLSFFVSSIYPMAEENKRSARDIHRLLQMVKDDPETFQRHLDVINGTHKITEPKWYEKDHVIYFTLPPVGGMTGMEWVGRLRRKGFKVSNEAEGVLRSSEFQTTIPISYSVAVLKGELFKNSDRITKNIYAEADLRNLLTPHPEVACLIREHFSEDEIKEMGLWRILTMHETIEDGDGDPSLLSTGRDLDREWLSARCCSSDRKWRLYYGFAFVVEEVEI